jgi:hypothetical protein
MIMDGVCGEVVYFGFTMNPFGLQDDAWQEACVEAPVKYLRYGWGRQRLYLAEF